MTAFSQDGKQYTAPARPGKTVKMSIYGTNTYVSGRPTGPRAQFEIGEGLTTAFDPREAHYPLNQAALALVPDGESIKVTLGTMTPNFKEFQVSIDGGAWQAAGEGKPLADINAPVGLLLADVCTALKLLPEEVERVLNGEGFTESAPIALIDFAQVV